MSRVHALLYHAIQAARGEPVARARHFLEQSQWWKVERLREVQLARLRGVLAAAERARHYRDAWSVAGVTAAGLRDLDDLARYPILEKAHLRADPEAIRDPAHHDRVNVEVTTGSTGVPLLIYRSRPAGAWGRAAQLRGRGWYGVRLGDREVRFGGLALEALGRRRARLIDCLMNRIRLVPFDLSDDRLSEYAARLRRERPRVLYGYPSAITTLAGYLERRGGPSDFGLRVVMTSSERLFEHRRVAIARVFGCPVADEYGAAEVSIIAMECPRGGLHLASENVFLEVVDASGRGTPMGEPGEVVVTDLHNLAAPLVRYRLGDRARLVPGTCPCGRGLPRMEILEGSSFGELRLPDGRCISGVVFYFLAESLIGCPDAGLSEIILVKRPGGILARVVPRRGGNPQHVDELRRRLLEILGPGTALEIARVERIERRGSDKYRILIEEPS